jgi:hypothetical protein
MEGGPLSSKALGGIHPWAMMEVQQARLEGNARIEQFDSNPW